ncbi:MAG TPA: HK97 family phage prohead protease, partial [Elusimicrobiales bacterium]|nr:HK97 family phage prohead protease [Elusimicrobiales bacterium]
MKTQTILPEKVGFSFPVQVLKYAEEAGEFHVVGYAATTDFDLQGDIITEEALKASSLDLLKNSTVLLNHDMKLPIGKVTKVEFDKHGLLIDALISSTEPDIIQKIKEGVLNKFSIRGQVLERERQFSPEHDRMVNIIQRMSLVEVSLVSVPANPEAKAIGWYIAKALSETTEQGDKPMPDEVIIEEVPPQSGTPASEAPAPETAAASPEPQKPKAPAPEEKPKDADTFAQVQSQKPAEIQKADKGVIKTQLEPAFVLLDKLIALGGPTAAIAQQVKALLKQLAGDPVPPYQAVAKTISADDLTQLIAGEVAKQVEAAIKAVPTLRKGIIQTDAAAEEVRKQFDSL